MIIYLWYLQFRVQSAGFRFRFWGVELGFRVMGWEYEVLEEAQHLDVVVEQLHV